MTGVTIDGQSGSPESVPRTLGLTDIAFWTIVSPGTTRTITLTYNLPAGTPLTRFVVGKQLQSLPAPLNVTVTWPDGAPPGRTSRPRTQISCWPTDPGPARVRSGQVHDKYPSRRLHRGWLFSMVTRTSQRAGTGVRGRTRIRPKGDPVLRTSMTRSGRVLRMATAAALVVGVATAFAAGPAGAYTSPSGTVSGTCSPGNQDVAVGAAAAAINCTFTFTVASSDPVTFTTSAGTLGSHSTNVGGNTAFATITGITCGSSNIPVSVGITSHPVSNPDVSGSTVALVSCAPGATATSFIGCGTAFAGPFPGTEQRTCSFSTTAPNGAAVSYNTTGTNSFAFAGSQTVSGHGFMTQVVYPTGGTPVTVTGSVAATGTSAASSSLPGTVN